MPNRKKKGVFYTPHLISDFMVEYCFKQLDTNGISILEPSAGDGIFVQSINAFVGRMKIEKVGLTIVEIDKNELAKAKKKVNSSCFSKLSSINEDFLAFTLKDKRTYSIVIGNPPYIKKNFLSEKQMTLCGEIHERSALADRQINNIWTAFVVACQSRLDNSGVLAFVLPSDLLQVKYAREIRCLLETNFERLEIFTVDKEVFKEIGQQIVILFAYRKAENQGVFFFEFSDLSKKKYRQISSNG